MHRVVSVILFLFSLTYANGQSEPHRYRFSIGEEYYLKTSMKQNTETENMELQGNVSLDIKSTLLMAVSSITSTGHYELNCWYEGLTLNFFSPGSEIFISTEASEFHPIRTYITELEKNTFKVVMSDIGEFILIEQLDSIINSFLSNLDTVTTKDSIIVKTIKESFGEEALRGLGNTVLNVFNDSSATSCTKESTFSFNAKPVQIIKNIYYHPASESTFRVQGIGIIEETTDIFELREMALVTTMKGNQTYDFLCSYDTGWIKKGVSKQRIHTLSVMKSHNDIPDGLKIPSFTESEYIFKGGRISEVK
ncbi:MAG: DUF6263 family protein [Bacteroidales bacterium]